MTPLVVQNELEMTALEKSIQKLELIYKPHLTSLTKLNLPLIDNLIDFPKSV